MLEKRVRPSLGCAWPNGMVVFPLDLVLLRSLNDRSRVGGCI
jgi:hypothetical protein